MEITQINPSEYHSQLKLDRSDIFSPDSWLSKSAVYELYQNSLYKWRYFPRQYSDSPAMTWGSLVDCIITSPEDFDEQFVTNPYDSFRTKAAKEWKDATLDAGKQIITPELLEQANAAVAVLTKKHKYAAAMIEKSASQVVMMNRVQHPASERTVGIKGLVDLAPEGEPFLMDLKTTRDFTAGGFEKTIAKFGYHVQAGLYLSLWNSINPDDQRDRFQIMWQDSSSPYEVAVTEIPQSDIADGQEMFNHLLGRIVKAAEKDYWPMLFPKPVLIGRASFGEYTDMEEVQGFTTI